MEQVISMVCEHKIEPKECKFECLTCDRKSSATNVCRSCIDKDGLQGVWMKCVTHNCMWCA
jgi:hypothetical protein